MYIDCFKKNTIYYLIIKRITKDTYELIEFCHSFDTAIKFIRTYGNSRYYILKIKLKEVIHWKNI